MDESKEGFSATIQLNFLREVARRWSKDNPDVSIEIGPVPNGYEVTVQTMAEPRVSYTANLDMHRPEVLYATDGIRRFFDHVKVKAVAVSSDIPVDTFADALVQAIKHQLARVGLFRGCELTFKLSPDHEQILIQAGWFEPDTDTVWHKDTVRIPACAAQAILGNPGRLVNIIKTIVCQAVACRERHHPHN